MTVIGLGLKHVLHVPHVLMALRLRNSARRAALGERAARGKMKPHVPPSDKDRWRQLVKLWRVLACGAECGYPHLERRNVIKLESRRHAVPPART